MKTNESDSGEIQVWWWWWRSVFTWTCHSFCSHISQYDDIDSDHDHGDEDENDDHHDENDNNDDAEVFSELAQTWQKLELESTTVFQNFARNAEALEELYAF